MSETLASIDFLGWIVIALVLLTGIAYAYHAGVNKGRNMTLYEASRKSMEQERKKILRVTKFVKRKK